MTDLISAARAALGMLERADCSTGYCCCGSRVESHSIGDGHAPVDDGDYHQGKAIESLRTAIAAAETGEEYKRGYEEALNDCIRNGVEWARSMFANNAEHIKSAAAEQAEPKINYFAVQQFAAAHRLNYNETCAALRAWLAAPAQVPQPAIDAHNAGFVEASRIHGAEIERLRAALIPLANAHTPIEREMLTDEDSERARAALGE